MKNIRKLRVHEGMTQKELAALLGLKQQTICKYENLNSEISLHILKKLSSIFKIPIDILIDEEIDIVAYKIKADNNYDVIEENILNMIRKLDSKRLKLLLKYLNELSK